MMKKLILVVHLLIVCLCFKTYSAGIIYSGENVKKVAILGNSNASLMSWYLNIDRDNNVAWQDETFSNNSIAGDTINSILASPEGQRSLYGFYEKASLYSHAIVFLGTNEILGHMDPMEYAGKLEAYLGVLLQANSNLKIILMEIPDAEIGDRTDYYREQREVFNKLQQEVAGRYEQIDYFSYDQIDAKLRDEGTASVHLSYETFLQIWDLIEQRYHIKNSSGPRIMDLDKWNVLR